MEAPPASAKSTGALTKYRRCGPRREGATGGRAAAGADGADGAAGGASGAGAGAGAGSCCGRRETVLPLFIAGLGLGECTYSFIVRHEILGHDIGLSNRRRARFLGLLSRRL